MLGDGGRAQWPHFLSPEFEMKFGVTAIEGSVIIFGDALFP